MIGFKINGLPICVAQVNAKGPPTVPGWLDRLPGAASCLFIFCCGQIWLDLNPNPPHGGLY